MHFLCQTEGLRFVAGLAICRFAGWQTSYADIAHLKSADSRCTQIVHSLTHQFRAKLDIELVQTEQ